ncbi:cell division protein FtsQ/DivIB [Stieleria varia]|uniref:Cell division protein FtsQ n=1 Tax=Stieleria varia TaxID=2528005 RepID=A0A5C6B3L3_9BACT|nr:hypothetical protein [Stieleria varia]TWU06347.1 Cell division protein FtsQ [Stieleria varia]
MAMRGEQDQEVRPIRDLLRRLIAAPTAWSFLWPIGLMIIGYVAYHRWGAEHLRTQFQGVQKDHIRIPTPHDYVRTDIVQDVYEDTALNELSVLDRHATAKIADAFATHPWVRKVDGVRKLPHGEIEVSLEYREPVAVFHVTSETRSVRDDLYFALDGEGILLPNEQLNLQDAPKFIHIEVPDEYPHGNVGTAFGERRVENAALLAKLLAPLSDKIKVAKITATGDPRKNIVPQLQITLGNDMTVEWGSPPGMEQPGERDALSKLTDLVNGQFQNGDDLRIAARRDL